MFKSFSLPTSRFSIGIASKVLQCSWENVLQSFPTAKNLSHVGRHIGLQLTSTFWRLVDYAIVFYWQFIWILSCHLFFVVVKLGRISVCVQSSHINFITRTCNGLMDEQRSRNCTQVTFEKASFKNHSKFDGR